MTATSPILLTPHFALVEFSCRSGAPIPATLIPNVKHLADQLEVLRVALGKPIRIVSGYRSPTWNAHVKGAEHSQHLVAKAADIRVAGIEPGEMRTTILALIRDGKMHDGGLGLYPSWVHYDVRDNPARW